MRPSRDPLPELCDKCGMNMPLTRELKAAQRRKAMSPSPEWTWTSSSSSTTPWVTPIATMLRALATAIAKSCRSTGFACGVGGDGFCVNLPDAKEGIAQEIALKISEAFTHLFPEFPMSAGVACTGSMECMSESELLAAADQAMYAARQLIKA